MIDEKNLAKKEGSAVGAVIQPGRGFEEGVQREDLLIPRAELVQPQSPAALEDPGKYHLGMIINSITRDVLPEEFIPVFKFSRWIRFNPRNKEDVNFDPAYDLGAEIWRSDDPEDPRVLEQAVFGPNGEKPLATKSLNFFAFFPGTKMPIIVRFVNTSYKAGKKLLSLATYAGGDMFARKYKLTSSITKNDKGTFAIFEVAPAGLADEESFKVAENWYNQFKTKTKNIEVHDPDKEPGSEG
jgi:hypothetical protein